MSIIIAAVVETDSAQKRTWIFAGGGTGLADLPAKNGAARWAETCTRIEDLDPTGTAHPTTKSLLGNER